MNEFESVQKMLEKTGKAGDLMDLASTAEGKKIEGMIDKSALEKAMSSGDVKTMEAMLRQVLSTGEGKALAKKISGIMGK